jgi:gliding motility-associated-like protein
MLKPKKRLKKFYALCVIAIFSAVVFAQAPANNSPCTAAVLNVGSSCNYVTYNSTNATPTPSVPQPTGTNCAGWGGGRDVWFRVVVPANGAVTVSANQFNILTFADGVMAAYRGTSCNNLTLIGCDDDGGPGLMPQISLVGETPGTSIWFRFWRNNNNTGGQFQICASNAVPNNQDCLGAIPLCQSSYSTVASYTGVGNVPGEINELISCLANGERNDVWYTFTVQTAGNVNFTITPNISTNDYDWAVFNLTNANCNDIASNASLQVSCNYSSTTGSTGTSSGSVSNSQGQAGTGFNAPIPVTAGQTYVVNISNWSSTGQSGYNIDFSASTATILDNVGPRLRAIDSIPVCGQNRIAFSMNENVMCNAVQAGDFSLTGPGGNIPITSVTSVYCQLGTTYDNSFRVNTATGFTQTGTYTLCLTNTVGNISDLCGNQSQSTSPCLTFTITALAVNASKTDVICRGASTGTATASATGANGAYTYLWSNNATTASISNLPAGTYTVTVTSGECTRTASVTVNEPALGVSASTTTTPSNCGQTDGTATVTPANGIGTYTYLWSNGQTAATANNLAAGNYSVTVRDANNCSVVAAATVSNQNSTLALSVRGDTACFGVGQGRAFVTAIGGTPNYTYLWSNAQTSDTVSNLANGVYAVTVRDALNCSVTASTGVLRHPAITFNAPTTTQTNCGQSNGTATVNPTGGGGGFSYNWSNGQTSQTATGLVAGSYDVTVRDANNCTATSTIVVTNQGSTLAITLKGDTACDNPSATKIFVTATGGATPYTYLWSNTLTSDTVESIPNGIYSVTVRDASNCTVTGSTGVLRYAPVTFNPSVIANATCGLNNGSATVNAAGGSGGFTYAWSNAQTTQTATALGTGAYSVTAYDANQCSSTNTVSITQAGSPAVSNITKTDPACYGGANGTATATATGGTGAKTYSWSNGQTTQTATGLSFGTYTVTATDANSCTATGTINITQPDSLAFTSSSIVDASCFGGNNGSITLAYTGGTGIITYVWSNSQTGATATALVAGSYSVTVRDANNCTSSRSFVVAEPTDIAIQFNTTDVACRGDNTGSATANTSGSNGNFTYLWSNSQTTSSIGNLLAGSYAVTVTSGSCTKVASATINEPALGITTTSTTTPSDCAQANGSATVNAANGTGSYTYVWNSGQTSQTATNLSAGTYSVTVSDANNCSVVASVAVPNQNSTLAIALMGDTACGGVGQGVAFVTPSGGTPPYSILWSNSQTVDTIQNLANGVYSVTVSDALSCSVSASASVLRFADIVFNAPTIVAASCNQSNGSATVNPTAGSGGFTYLWSNGENTSTISGLAAGVYDVTVADVNLCTATSSVTITQDGAPAITNTSQTDVSCFGGSDGTATIAAAGGAGSISYLWSNGQATATATNLAAGAYTVSATDLNNCPAIFTFTIQQPQQLVFASAVIDSPSCLGGNDGSITVNFIGGTGTISYVWSNSQVGNAASSLSAGIYTVTATDANNCTSVRNITLDQPLSLNVNVLASPALCFGEATGSATATGSGGTQPYTYQWSVGATTSNFNGQLAQGSYSVTISDANSCTASGSFSIAEPALLSLSTASTPVSCANVNDGTVTATPVGGSQPFSFEILGNGIQQSNTTGFFENLAVATYNLIVTDVNNCTAQIQSSVAPAQIDAFNVATDSTTCFGDVYRDGGIIITAQFPQNGPYYYSLDGVNYRTKARFDSLGHGSYQVFVKSAKGCESTLAATVFQPEKLAAVVSPSLIEIALGESSVVNVSSNSSYTTTYEWSPITGLSCNDCAAPVVSPFTETEYTLLVKDTRDGKKFCTAKAELLVVVGPHGEVLIPNLFSPNSDGINDVFAIYGNNIREVSLKIFNRWGEKVFDADNIYGGWDGTYKAVEQPSGVYTYTADIVFLNNKKMFKSGTVTLVR